MQDLEVELGQPGGHLTAEVEHRGTHGSVEEVQGEVRRQEAPHPRRGGGLGQGQLTRHEGLGPALDGRDRDVHTDESGGE